MPEIDRYATIRKSHTPSYGPDGDRLVFLMDATGKLQLWERTPDREGPRQLTTVDGRVMFVTHSPTRREVAFGVEGPDESRTQLYRLGENGGVTAITDTPTAAHRWGGWSSDGEYVAYAANDRTEAAFDVYVHEREGDRRRVLETDGWYDVLGWAPDDDALLVRETTTELKHRLSVVNLQTGAHRQLTAEPARYESVDRGPAGDIYLVTDRDADTSYVARLETDTGELCRITDGDEWNVEGLAVHTPTGRLAFGRNVDGYTEMTTAKIVDDETIRELPTPRLPNGVVGEVSFTPSGDRLATTVTTRRRAPTIYAVTLDTGDADRVTDPDHAGIPRDSFVTPDLVRYESHDGLEIPAFVSFPPTDGPHPALVDLHGGPESQRRPSFDGFRQYLLQAGYALFEPNVRGSAGYGERYAQLDDGRNRPDAVGDVLAATDWLRDHDRIDGDRLGVFGTSYGGYLALTTLAEHDVWASGASIAGIVDLVSFIEETGSWRRPLREAEYGSLDEHREFLRRHSPADSPERITTPVLLVHGEHDRRVPVDAVRSFADAVREQGTPVETCFLSEESHSISSSDSRVTVYRRLAAFFDRTLDQ